MVQSSGADRPDDGLLLRDLAEYRIRIGRQTSPGSGIWKTAPPEVQRDSAVKDDLSRSSAPNFGGWCAVRKSLIQLDWSRYSCQCAQSGPSLPHKPGASANQTKTPLPFNIFLRTHADNHQSTNKLSPLTPHYFNPILSLYYILILDLNLGFLEIFHNVA